MLQFPAICAEGLQSPWPLTGVIRARHPKKVEKKFPGLTEFAPKLSEAQ